MTETPDLELEAQWQEAALVGSPQIGSPRKMPQAPHQNPPVSSQEQALSFKRRKGASKCCVACATFSCLIFYANPRACSLKAGMRPGKRHAGGLSFQILRSRESVHA